jgi:hypothetical protein
MKMLSFKYLSLMEPTLQLSDITITFKWFCFKQRYSLFKFNFSYKLKKIRSFFDYSQRIWIVF